MRWKATLLVFVLVPVVAWPAPASNEVPLKLVRAALERHRAFDLAAHLTDSIGPRLTGTTQAEEAVAWGAETLRSWGLEVRLQRLMVPRWVRGEAEAMLVAPAHQSLVVTALGGSVATPPDGIAGEIVEVSSYDELGDRLRGKIVLYNREMSAEVVAAGRSFDAYSEAVEFRGSGASRAAKHGAVAALVRSVTTRSLRTPHTGGMRYEEGIPQIPAAAVTTEDADLIHRLLARGERVRVHLRLTPQQLPDVESANVIAEIRGRELPDEIVVIGGHIDSWDLGTGAIDNASGIAMTMETMRLIQELGIRPRRTIRAVLFMNEENGLRGAKAYAAAHPPATHFAAVEADAGVGAPQGFFTTLDAAQIARFAPAVEALAPIGANRFLTSPSTGADTSPLTKAGVVGFGVFPDSRFYFDYHHSPADTLDKVDPEHLQQNAAAMAVLTWVLADLPHGW